MTHAREEPEVRVKNKEAIMTGAAQGIGAAFAVGFAKEGAKIVIGGISDASIPVSRVEAELKKKEVKTARERTTK